MKILGKFAGRIRRSNSLTKLLLRGVSSGIFGTDLKAGKLGISTFLVLQLHRSQVVGADSPRSKIPGILLLTSPMGPAMTRIDPLIFGCGQG